MMGRNGCMDKCDNKISVNDEGIGEEDAETSTLSKYAIWRSLKRIQKMLAFI